VLEDDRGNRAGGDLLMGVDMLFFTGRRILAGAAPVT